MLDWDYYTVGVFEFVRGDNGRVVALWWQWEETDWPGLWVKRNEGMSEEDVQRAVEQFGRFRKPKKEEESVVAENSKKTEDSKEAKDTTEDKEADPAEVQTASL